MQYILLKLANGAILLLYSHGISNFLYAKSIYFYTIAIPSQNLQLFVCKVYLLLYYSCTLIEFATFCTQSLQSTILQLYPHRFCNFLYAKSIQYYTIAILPQILQLFVRKVYRVLYYSYTPIEFATFCTQSLYSTILQLNPLKLATFCTQRLFSTILYIFPHEICNFLYANPILYYAIAIPS